MQDALVPSKLASSPFTGEQCAYPQEMVAHIKV